jgi:hypothetical protein
VPAVRGSVVVFRDGAWTPEAPTLRRPG